ncbi:hypothetical protein HPB50_024639 [Hyalomma asiaticum]|uniref:Uncharacterized protein n=1 Tax=Hyalomma asiaticum TaxID=266040 RepID=A0ACB7T579_HYAAI|nr:hypothetical protein HPB50_024639 [Hyalomma asiaticum]
MAGGALQAALAAALLLAGCGGRCPAGVDGHGSGGGGGAHPPSSAALAGDDQRQLKLDAVRHQILSKLSLRERPPQRREPAPPLARELALEALRRVHLLPEPRALEDQGAPDPRQEDDYYGRTAEIIAFAEPVGACCIGLDNKRRAEEEDFGGLRKRTSFARIVGDSPGEHVFLQRSHKCSRAVRASRRVGNHLARRLDYSDATPVQFMLDAF